MKSLNTALLLILILIHAGCGPTDITISKKPSYADLVVTYNAEVETLDRLEEKRTAAIAEYFSQAQGKAIESAVQSIKSGTKVIPSDPNDSPIIGNDSTNEIATEPRDPHAHRDGHACVSCRSRQ